MTTLMRLDAAVRAVAPIWGVAIGAGNAVSVDYQPTATQAHRDAAAAVIAGFDWSAAADAAYRDAQEPDLATLRDQATQAVADISTFLAIASPSNAQLAAEVKAIDQRQRAIIKALARLAVRTLT
jgi:hypothetical protein